MERSHSNSCPAAVTLALFSALIGAPATVAQDLPAPALRIRVESNEVLVPVFVLAKSRLEAFQEQFPGLSRYSEVFRDLTVEGLVGSDFEVFEDGRQQRIEKVMFGLQDVRRVRDAAGHYAQSVGAGEGLWLSIPTSHGESERQTSVSGPDTDQTYTYDGTRVAIQPPPIPAYLISYVPVHSSAAPCHEISVKVSRDDSVVYAVKGYCDDRGPVPYDLFGTGSSRELRERLSSANKANIQVFLNAVPLISHSGKIPLQITLDFPAQSLTISPKDCASGDSARNARNSMRILGDLLTEKLGLAAQFGDMLLPGQSFLGVRVPLRWPNLVGCTADDVFGYQRQIYLPPGQYKLRAVFAVGEKRFGRAEISVTVEAQDDRSLAISGIVLARRYAEASKSADDVLTGIYVPLVSRGVEYLPSANLTFKRTDAFFFYLEVRGPLQDQPKDNTIQVRLRIVDAKTGAVVRDLAPLNAADFAIPGNPIVPIGSGVHIEDLPPGNYQLQAQATTLATTAGPGSISITAPPPPPQTTPWHSVSFTIE